MNKDLRRKEISELILSYLRKNIDAGDTLEGIINYWVVSEIIDISLSNVTLAVEDLLKKGLIRKQTIAGENIFKIKKL